jgi:hypothetical protein
MQDSLVRSMIDKKYNLLMTNSGISDSILLQCVKTHSQVDIECVQAMTSFWEACNFEVIGYL